MSAPTKTIPWGLPFPPDTATAAEKQVCSCSSPGLRDSQALKSDSGLILDLTRTVKPRQLHAWLGCAGLSRAAGLRAQMFLTARRGWWEQSSPPRAPPQLHHLGKKCGELQRHDQSCLREDERGRAPAANYTRPEPQDSSGEPFSGTKEPL